MVLLTLVLVVTELTQCLQQHLTEHQLLHSMLTWQKILSPTIITIRTVVALGGAEEITAVNEELPDSVSRVVSSPSIFPMNVTKVEQLSGCRLVSHVIGMVNKGDRLVSAGNGLARVASADELTNAFNVPGRANYIPNKHGRRHCGSPVTIN